MHSPTLFSLLRKRPLPSPDRTEPVLNTGVMFDRQFSRLFFLQPPFLPSFSRVPGSTAPVRWRDEVGRAGTRVGRRVDKKTAVLFHLCLFFFSPSFSLFSQPAFSLAVLVFGSPGPGPIFGRHQCGAEVSLRFFGLINIQQADKTEKFKVEIQL